MSIIGLVNTTNGQGVEGVAEGDSRLSDARTPSSHASSHSTGQSDAISVANIGGVASNDSRLSDARTPTAHASSHATGQSDAISAADVGAAAANHSHAALSQFDVSSNLILPKTAGRGIKIDLDAPTFGWKDLIGPVTTRNVGATAPDFNVFRSAQRQYQFAVNDEEWIDFHIPHDYLPGSNLFIHAHWAVNVDTVSSGGVTWEWAVSYAKGYDQAQFSADILTEIYQAAPTVNGQYRHMIAEVQLSSLTPNASQLDSALIEVDGLILTRIKLKANTMNGTPAPFLLFSDIHYQSTQSATKDKNYPFYT